MSWHHPDLYFFLCLLAGLAAFLAPSIIDELTSTIDELFGRRRKPPVVEPRRSTVNEKAVDRPSPPKYVDPPSPPKYLKKAKPLDGLQRDRPRPTVLSFQRRFTPGEVQRLQHRSHVMDEIDESAHQEVGKQATERFSRLCESVNKEQASRVRDHFGIVGGAPPAEGRGRKGNRP